jgi:hypothetical protein
MTVAKNTAAKKSDEGPTRSVSVRLGDEDLRRVDTFARTFAKEQKVDLSRAKALAILVRRGLDAGKAVAHGS